MRNKKDKSFQKSLKTIRQIAEAKLARMPAAAADSTRAEIHRIAASARRVVRGKPAKPEQVAEAERRAKAWVAAHPKK